VVKSLDSFLRNRGSLLPPKQGTALKFAHLWQNHIRLAVYPKGGGMTSSPNVLSAAVLLLVKGFNLVLWKKASSISLKVNCFGQGIVLSRPDQACKLCT
jgi:hypothetical protein